MMILVDGEQKMEPELNLPGKKKTHRDKDQMCN